MTAMSVKVSAARSTVADLERRLADAERMRDEAQGELDAVIVEVGSCPTCGSNTPHSGVSHSHILE